MGPVVTKVPNPSRIQPGLFRPRDRLAPPRRRARRAAHHRRLGSAPVREPPDRGALRPRTHRVAGHAGRAARSVR